MKKILKKTYNISNKQILSGKWLCFKSVDFMINGKKFENYEYIERTTRITDIDGVDIIPFIKFPKSKKDSKLILIANYRPPVGRFVLEWPAGLVEDKNDFYKDAMRELKEETGYMSKLPVELLNENNIPITSPVLYGDPWKSNECGKSIILEIDGDDPCNNEMNARQILEETEDISIHFLELKRSLVQDLEELAQKNEYLIFNHLIS